MIGRHQPNPWSQAALCACVTALLSSGVVNVLLAVTETLLWPLIVGVAWVVVAAVVSVTAYGATPSESRMRRDGPRPVHGPLNLVG